MFRKYETENGFNILKKTLLFLIHYPAGLLLSLLTIACDAMLVFLLLYTEYTFYNISFLNPASFYQLLELDIWKHFLRIIIYLSFLFFAFFIKILLTILFTQTILFYLRKKKSFLNFTYYMQTLHTIGILSLIYTLNAFNNFLGFIFIQDLIIKILNILQGKPTESYAYMNTPAGFLFLPVFVDQKKSSIVTALNTSETLLQKTFGQATHHNFSFLLIDIMIFIGFFITLGIFINYHYSFITACLITFICYIIIRTLINYLLIIFKTETYEYTQNKKCMIFTQKELQTYFST